ncbi:hypothetical protein GCM10027396_25820 [Insolitispirillum peregrinum]
MHHEDLFPGNNDMNAVPLAKTVVVLGARIHDDGTLSPALVRRLQRLVLLWQRDRGRPGAIGTIVLSGGRPKGHPGEVAEAGVMAEWLMAAGVPGQMMVLEDVSRTTRENALYSLMWARRCGVRKVHVLTDWAHLPRAMLVFLIIGRGWGIRVRGVAAPLSWSWSSLRAIGRECAAIAADAIRAWHVSRP